MAQCKGTNKQGGPCGAPVVKDSYCRHHHPDPEMQRKMQEDRRKGGLATKRAFDSDGLSEEDMGPLRTHEDAERRLDVVMVAIADKRLSHNQGKAIIQGIKTWIDVRESSMDKEIYDELKDKVEYLSSELNKARRSKLKAV